MQPFIFRSFNFLKFIDVFGSIIVQFSKSSFSILKFLLSSKDIFLHKFRFNSFKSNNLIIKVVSKLKDIKLKNSKELKLILKNRYLISQMYLNLFY